jgi:hypothetical protein
MRHETVGAAQVPDRWLPQFAGFVLFLLRPYGFAPLR